MEIAIFRFDYGAIESALKAAVVRRVKVTALIANTFRGGVKRLRDIGDAISCGGDQGFPEPTTI